jgi:hypothetical protein
MTLHTPLAMQPTTGDPDVTYTGQEFRQLLNGIIAAGGGGIASEGCLGSGELAVSQRAAGANFSVDISQGHAFVLGNDITSQGQYFAWNDAVVNLVTPSAPGSGTRTHRVVLQIRDKQSNGVYTTYDAQFQLLQDTGTGEPAEPASAITLAHVSIAAGQASVTNANITDGRAQLAQAIESYTPVVGGGGTATFTTQAGWWIRIGKMIFFNAYIIIGTGGSGSSNVTVTAPTAIHRVNRQIVPFHAGGVGGGSGLKTGALIGLQAGSGNVFDRIDMTLNTVVDMTTMVGSNLTAGGFLTFQGWYREA